MTAESTVAMVSRTGREYGDDLSVYPERVLAECEAKRRIVELHPLPDVADVCGTCSGPGIEWWPCPTMRALALPYSDHPDYRDEWRS